MQAEYQARLQLTTGIYSCAPALNGRTIQKQQKELPMRPIKKILVAVKQPAGRRSPAVDKAAQLALAFGAELELFHALTTPIYLGYTAEDDRNWRRVQREDKRNAQASLDQQAADLQSRGVKASVAVAWDYPVYEAVVRRALHTGADLVVAERHGGKHTASWLLRYSDWELLRLCPVPFLLVKKPKPYARPVVLAALDPLHSFAKPARLDAEILQLAGSVAGALRGSVHAAHAYLALPVYPGADALPARTVAKQNEARARQQATGAFEAELQGSDIAKSNRHVVHGHPVDVLPRLARTTGSAIAVLGAISRSGLKKLLIGNTAEAIIDSLPCDILVVKPAQFKTRVGRRARGPSYVIPPEVQWI
jgi:universal stress protein E